MGIVPNLNPNHMRTYQIIAPVPTHFRKATCAEIQCRAHVNGWRTIVGADSPQAQYIRAQSGRRFTERALEGSMTEFTFEAGQACFASDTHKVPLERDPFFRVRENGLTRTHTRPDLWTEDMAEHLDRIRSTREG